MHGDFTLDPFQYREGVSRVLVQQGRVQLDSDANEQTETLLRFLRGLARDIIGPHGGVENSFRIGLKGGSKTELQIERGEYYVDGIRCVLPPDGDLWEVIADPSKTQARDPVALDALPNFVKPANDDGKANLLYYLDVYERHVSSSEDDSLREVALLGADTASRAMLTWQVRTLVIDDDFKELMEADFGWPFRGIDNVYVALNLRLRTGVRMRAQAVGSESTNPCIISPEARYRGSENRLFRVEIHDPGEKSATGTIVRKPAFKWSQDNGAIVYPIRKVSGTTLHLGSLGRDARTQICVNDWVEIVDDDVVANPRFRPLLQVVEVSPANLSVVLNQPPDGTTGTDPKKHPILRRWASDLVELESDAATPETWIDLADGLQVAFSRLPRPEAGFRAGDYWLIPTRTAGGELLWPADDKGDPRAMPPNGIDHHYAPLATWMDRAAGTTPIDQRMTFGFYALPALPPTSPPDSFRIPPIDRARTG